MEFTTSYKSIKKNTISVRNTVRKMALDSISLFDNFKNEEDFKKNRIQFIYIHHIFNDEENDLINLLNFLSQYHTFISYSEAIKKILTNQIDKPYICISSDDGFKNNLRAAEILKEYGVSACFFICPGIIEESNEEKIKIFCKERLHFPPVNFLSWDDVESIVEKGHEIGSHTMHHINVAETNQDKLVAELKQSYKILKNRFGNIIHFAFPYGRYFHFTEEARKLVFDTGYQSCSSAERGCHVHQDVAPLKDELLIRRDNIILDWSLNHIKYFLRRNATHFALQQNKFIYS